MPLPTPIHRLGAVPLLLVVAGLALPSASVFGSEGPCGRPPDAAPHLTDPGGRLSDLSLAHWADQPAGMLTCSMGYFAEKCGDHDTALKIFDKCIAKGYAGAMIWKGLMFESGSGVPRDSARAAALFRQAAESGEGHYGALGKLHYASALHEGHGVPKDVAEARRWFERAAREGSEDAAEFLRTGYHTGARDLKGHGVGVPGAAVTGLALVRQASQALMPWRHVLAGLALLLALAGLGAWRQARRPHLDTSWPKTLA